MLVSPALGTAKARRYRPQAMHVTRTIIGGLVVLMLVGAAPVRATRSLEDPRPSDAPEANDGPYVGKFLVATPKMADPRFAKTVVLVLEHRVGGLEATDKGGAMGLVINRRIGVGPLGKLLEGSGIALDKSQSAYQVTLHYGGPVEGYLAFILHSGEYHDDPAARPVRGLAHGRVMLSTDASVMAKVAAGKGPRHSLFILGYAGWGPGQLEREIADGAWVVVPADADLVFGPDRGEALWQKTWTLRGVTL